MSKHKNEDYKITVVKYYLENNTNQLKYDELVIEIKNAIKQNLNRKL